MDIRVGDRLEMKKKHPCGGSLFGVFRVGMDFRLRCETCGREFLIPRGKAEKNIKRLLRTETPGDAGKGGPLSDPSEQNV